LKSSCANKSASKASPGATIGWILSMLAWFYTKQGKT
jgi:hypothetical protein